MTDLFDTQTPLPDYSAETRLHERGLETVAGVDEAGRGPLAGPVVAAAAILNPQYIPEGLNDSKKLTVSQREKLLIEITLTAHVGISFASANEIDDVNIRQASLNAMVRACRALTIQPDHVLVDGRDVPVPLLDRGTALIKGDSRSVSIAAASIVAKVLRDRVMVQMDLFYPEYGFAKHKGYGTKQHLEAIKKYGPCPLHRRSFKPVSLYA